VLDPSQFQVNEAWIVFTLNDAPIQAGEDGLFNVFALMDAASCFILSTCLVSSVSPEPSSTESDRLLEEGRAHKQQLPTTLFIPSTMSATLLAVAAEHQGITVVRVPDDQLLLFVGEAKAGFRERIGRSES
jgi:hypothetical protein